MPKSIFTVAHSLSLYHGESISNYQKTPDNYKICICFTCTLFILFANKVTFIFLSVIIMPTLMALPLRTGGA